MELEQTTPEGVRAPRRLRRVRLTHTLRGHTDEVLAVCLSPDGRLTLSGSRDGTLRLWHLETGGCRAVFAGHADAVTSVCLGPDGRFALSGGADGTLRRWRLGCLGPAAAVQVFRKRRATEPVTAVALSPDGRWALTRGVGPGLYRWEIASGRCVRCVPGFWRRFKEWFQSRTDPRLTLNAVRGGWRRPLAVSGDGGLVLLGDGDRLELRQLPDGGLVRGFAGHPGGVHAVCLSGDGHLAVSGGADGTVKTWEVASGRCLGWLRGHTDPVGSVCVSPDGRLVVSGSWDRTARLWDVAGGRCLATLAGHCDWVHAVCLSADASFALTAGADGTLRRWVLEWAGDAG